MFARRFLLLLVLCSAPALILAGAAYAGDDAPPAAEGAKATDQIAQLTPAELAFLESRIKGWDALPAAKKQLIARNVLRIRSMSPEQRKQFEERLGRMRGQDERWDRVRDHAGRMLIDRGLAHAARQKLGRAFEGRLRRSDISEHVFERSFARIFWEKVRTRAFVDGQPVAPDALPADLPDPLRERYAQLHERFSASEDAEERKGMSRMLGHLYGSMVSAQLRQGLARSDVKGTDAYVAAAAQKVTATWPEAFAESLSDPEVLLRAAENEEVKRSLRRLVRRDGKLSREESMLVVKLVERWATHNRKNDTEAGAEADALLRRVLREDLELAADVIDAMPPRSEVEKRAAWYLKLLRRAQGAWGGMRMPGNEPRKKGVRPGPWNGGRELRPLERPAGVSEADWQAFTAAVKAAGRPFVRAKPEGMSDEGWQIVRTAIKKRMEAFGRQSPKDRDEAK